MPHRLHRQLPKSSIAESMNKNLQKHLRPSNRSGFVNVKNEKISVDSILEINDRIGREVKYLRKARDSTLADLSSATGLSKGYLSQVERGISNPSIKALHSISRALDVTISWFFSPGPKNDEVLRNTIVRVDERRSLSFSSGITDELLSPNLSRKIELLRCTFSPGSISGVEPYTQRGEEAGYVISGLLHLWVND